MATIESILGEKILVNWRELIDLQPYNAKRPYNYGKLKESLLKHGFGLAFAGWQNDGKTYTIDGHTRKTVLLELIAEGNTVPDLLDCQLVLAKSRKEAIKILTEIYNQKHNPFDGDVLSEWLIDEDVEVDLDGVNVEVSEDGYSRFNKTFNANKDDSFIPSQTYPITVIADESEMDSWIKIKDVYGIKSDMKLFSKILKEIYDKII